MATYVLRDKAKFFAKEIVLLVTLICLILFSGCEDTKQAAITDSPKNIEHIGQIPDDFKRIIENDVFNGAIAFENRLLKSQIIEDNEENRTVTHHIQMMDLYGNTLAAYTCNSDNAYHVSTLTATRDGGFLFVLGFSDYAYGQNAWASDNGFASRIIKCDQNGKLEFETQLDGVDGYALQHCFEVNEHFYLFGEIETPETITKGIFSPSDIYTVVLDNAGTVVNTQSIAGSDYDSLTAVEMAENGFLLSIRAQSNDGDFVGSQSNGYPENWIFTVNYDLEITCKEIKAGRDYFDKRLGEKNGVPIYKSDKLLTDFDAGVPELFVDYEDFYLIVSSNITGEYENTPPMISSIWYYTESVYSAYNNSGKLIFRSSIDSSPDYDALVQEFYRAS